MDDGVFYTVAATTIPVYFLALTFQGTLFNAADDYLLSLLNGNYEFYKDWAERIRRHDTVTFANADLKRILYHGFRGVLIKGIYVSVTIIVALSALGEFLALQALYNGVAESWQHQVVLAAVEALTVTTAVVLLARVYARMYTAKYRVFRLFLEQLNHHVRTMLARATAEGAQEAGPSGGQVTTEKPAVGGTSNAETPHE
jgi:hypothetical protein